MSKQAKQVKLDSFPSENQKKPSFKKKQIIITKFGSTLVWDELFLEVEFKLSPSKRAFSKIKTELWFDHERTKSFLFDVLHSFGPTDEFKLRATLELQGLSSGTHSVKVEIYELGALIENQNHTEKEIKIEYTPQTKKARLKEVPIIKKIEAEGIATVSDSEKRIYREMKESMKKEIVSKREE